MTWDDTAPTPDTLWVSIEPGNGTIPYTYMRKEGNGTCSSLQDFNNWSLQADTQQLPGGQALVEKL
ncbi:MAG: hypothetical protein H6765_08885 [Candidatus Peribacteria bacterium]|nr:MAG: hypothetical protein H6765_08885 [Candidatus Peribacteria bacterium]